MEKIMKTNLDGARQYLELYHESKDTTLLHFANDELNHFVYFAERCEVIQNEYLTNYAELYFKINKLFIEHYEKSDDCAYKY